MKVYREITPLGLEDVFVLIDSIDNGFDYPIHNHPEYELTLVMGSSGRRIVGDSTEKYQDNDLVLIGPFLHHKWDGDEALQAQDVHCRVITLQFEMNLFDSKIFRKKPFFKIRKMLESSSRGIQFSGQALSRAREKLIQLTELNGMASILNFLDLMNGLAESGERSLLASEGFSKQPVTVKNERIKSAYQYILDNFTRQDLKVGDVAGRVNMSDSAFSHFFKKSTNKSFKQFLLDLRIGHACKLLIETDQSISEIGYQCFNNLTNFNRLFKKYRHCTPFEYRKSYKEKDSFDWTTQKTLNQFLPDGEEVRDIFKPKAYAARLVHP
ncbi:MAG: helix-turn-helix transcriptional regulator [Lewinellaceae bacterium]|nr:helix-turn-helix domain-containing protein [Phaeodactylibacter sp.]MCB0614156.1 helix-turn-helix domain-containing protein [Phaeodactylibacter sp.]MCB9352479.1 helix-turn-helix transcriptional regulator [Lewinellaceae bacterium]